MSNKIELIKNSSVYNSLLDVIHKKTSRKVSIYNEKEIINMITNPNLKNSNIDNYLNSKLNKDKILISKRKIIISNRKDIFKRINYLKKKEIEAIVFFTYKDLDNELSSLIDMFSDKIRIVIVQINFVNKRSDFKTNNKSNIFIYNVLKNLTTFPVCSFAKNPLLKKKKFNKLIEGSEKIESNNELRFLRKIVKSKRIESASILFTENNRYSYSDNSYVSINESVIDKLKVIVEEYEKKMKNKRKFVKSLHK